MVVKEEVRGGDGQREQFRGSSGWRRSEGGAGEEHTRSPSPRGFPLAKGLQGWEAAPGSWCGGVWKGGQSGSGAQARKL